MKRIDLKHPALGIVTGVRVKGGVVQYLGIPYATLDHPFAASEVRTSYEGHINAIEYGPTVIAPHLGCDIEFGLIQQSLEKPKKVPKISALEGLNLNITVPDGSHRGLPVLVFVHGGGFLFGGSWAPHYDLSRIVSHSVSLGKPIIGVSINYRVGAAGFLDSRELRACGLPRNRGFLDQKNAFQWLARNIEGFGGDPERLTALGQSAGGSSVMHLLDFDTPDILFQRVACLSGNKVAAALVPSSVAQGAYTAVLEALDIDASAPVSDQVATLVAKLPEELLASIPMTIPFGPVVDDDNLPSFRAMKSDLEKKPRVPLLIGSTGFDGGVFGILGIFAGRNPDNLAADFANIFIHAIPKAQRGAARDLLALYGIPQATADAKPQPVEFRILQFGTDVKYFASAMAYAASWPAESWLYYFREPNPWEGPHKGRATHVLDLAYAFLNYEHVMDKNQRQVAQGFSDDLIRFVCGEAPWPQFREGGMRVYGDSAMDTPAVRSLGHDGAGPSAKVRALFQLIGYDSVTTAWDAYFLRK